MSADVAERLRGEGFDDVFVGYPTADRHALARLAALAAERPDDHPALMVDDELHGRVTPTRFDELHSEWSRKP